MNSEAKKYPTEAEGIATAKEGDVVFKTGLWRSVTKKGIPCLNGKIAKYWINVFNITNPTNPKSPIARLYLRARDNGGDGIQVLDNLEKGLGLWSATSKKGMEYLKGKTADYYWHIYPTIHKRSASSPDFTLSIYRKGPDRVQVDVTEKNEQPSLGFGKNTKPSADAEWDEWEDINETF